MFAWIGQLLGIDSEETREEASGKLRRRMQRETEGLLNYEMELSSSRRNALARSRSAAARSRSGQIDGTGQA
jgi:hypothetical protein